MILLAVAAAGGLGAAARFVVDALISARKRVQLPLGTLLINVTGSLLLGLLVGWAAHRGVADGSAGRLTAVAGTGFCGGYTTFSTACVESARLWRADGWTRGTAYTILTLAGSVAAAALGLGLGARL